MDVEFPVVLKLCVCRSSSSCHSWVLLAEYDVYMATVSSLMMLPQLVVKRTGWKLQIHWSEPNEIAGYILNRRQSRQIWPFQLTVTSSFGTISLTSYYLKKTNKDRFRMTQFFLTKNAISYNVTTPLIKIRLIFSAPSLYFSVCCVQYFCTFERIKRFNRMRAVMQSEIVFKAPYLTLRQNHQPTFRRLLKRCSEKRLIKAMLRDLLPLEIIRWEIRKS